jgi:hypothetical protein
MINDGDIAVNVPTTSTTTKNIALIFVVVVAITIFNI